MIPMTLVSTSPQTPASGRGDGVHRDASGRAAEDPTAFSLDAAAVPATSDADPDMGLVQAADGLPARGEHGGYRWGDPDLALARAYPMATQPAVAVPGNTVMPPGNAPGPIVETVPQMASHGPGSGDPAKAATMPIASATATPAAAEVPRAQTAAGFDPAPAAAPAARQGPGPAQPLAEQPAATQAGTTQAGAELTAKAAVAAFVPPPATPTAARYGSSLVKSLGEDPAAPHGDTKATTRATVSATTGAPGTAPSPAAFAESKTRADSSAPATAPLADMPAQIAEGGGDPAMLLRDADSARTDPARADGLRTDQPRAEVARAAGNQLVEAVRHGPNGNTEVALNPEELGRVRLGMTSQDGALHVSIIAERPETQDMLRRHIGQLQTDFRALGYTDVTFDFGHGGEQTARRPAPEPPLAAMGDGTDPGRTVGDRSAPSSADMSRPGGTTARLDLRI